jgi:hypothetical protein
LRGGMRSWASGRGRVPFCFAVTSRNHTTIFNFVVGVCDLSDL